MKKYLVLLCILISTRSEAQDFHFLHDNDSTTEGYKTAVLCDDGSLLMLGARINFTLGRQEQIWLNVSPGGGIIQSTHLISSPDFWCYSNFANLKKTSNGYVFPLAATYLSTNFDKLYNHAGLVLLDNQFDTITIKKYTDTSLYCDVIADCATLPDGGFLLAGYRTSPNMSQGAPLKGLLIRTDSLGNLIWIHTYQKEANKDHIAATLQPLSNNRTLVGASIRSDAIISINEYYKHKPWFFIIDNISGQVLRDTAYDSTYTGGAMCYADVNGGYFHWGNRDSLYNTYPEGPENFPRYIAKLDTNFNIQWLTNLSYFEKQSGRTAWIVKQLQNGDYLMIGNALSPAYVTYGWAARVNPSGAIVWDKYYVSDSSNDGYLADFVERQDGSIVMVGWATNDTLPQWHGQDAWIIGVDASGDVLPHSTFAANVHTRTMEFSIFPNPANHVFNLDVPESGTAELYDMSGRRVAMYSVEKGKSELKLDDKLASGSYLLQFTGKESGLIAGKQLVKE